MVYQKFTNSKIYTRVGRFSIKKEKQNMCFGLAVLIPFKKLVVA